MLIDIRMGPSKTKFIKPAGPENLRVVREGVVQFAVQRYTDVHGEVRNVVLPHCSYVPDCTFNLLSTSMLAKLDVSCILVRKPIS